MIFQGAAEAGILFWCAQSIEEIVMKRQTPSGTAPMVRRRNECGYTFVEVLIVVAVIAALAIAGFALYTGRGKTTEMTSMAQQVGQTIQSQQQLIYRGLRNSRVSAAEIAGSLNSLLAEHRFVESVTAGQNACSTPSASKSGLIIQLDPEEFDTAEEAGELQSIVHASLANVFTDENGTAFADKRSFHDVIDISLPGANNAPRPYLDSSAPAVFTPGTPPTATAYACLDNT